ncbi:MAG TPA: hypothetical protein VF185_03890 [Patescibacteria group bacterium]
MLVLILLPVEILVLYLIVRKTSRKIMTFFYRLTKSKKAAAYLFAFLFFPGTFVHEMSHFLTGLLLLVPVGKVELMPVIEEDGIKMGSVGIGKTDPIRRTLIGIAPILFGVGIILFSIFYVYQHNLFSQPLFVALISYIVFEVGNTMFSSKKDLEGVFAVFVTAIVFYAFLYFFGLRINININYEIIKEACIFLLIPILIDLVLLVL